MHLPWVVRPAQPVRWAAWVLLIGITVSDSMPVSGLKFFCFTNPVSMIYAIPSKVKEVSAMFVANTSFQQPSGAFLKIFSCCSELIDPYIGKMIIGGTE